MEQSKQRRIYLAVEFILFFFGIPVFLLIEGDLLHPSSVLLPLLAFVFLLLHYFTNFRWIELWHFPVKWRTVIKHLVIAFIVSLFMIAWVYLFDRGNLFNLPAGNWRVWIVLSTLYPVFSASVQEIIFRTFIFRRYERVLGNQQTIILISAIAFSFAHIFYFHFVSLLLTFVLGLYLSWLYARFRSVLFTAFLHSLYGNMIFTIGMGHYFWIDMFNWI